MTTRALSEAEKLARVPGISYVDGPAGRRAAIDGAGLEVFALVRAYLSLDGDAAELAANYPWLTAAQIQSGLAFYAAFPDEIDRWLAEERELFNWIEGENAETPAALVDQTAQRAL